MEVRYQPHVQRASLLQGLLSRSISNMSSIASVNEGIALYTGNIPNALIVDEEYSRWQTMWLTVPVNEWPVSLQECMKSCPPDRFPNLFVLLKLFAVLSLNSA